MKLNTLFVVIDQLRADCVFGPLAKHLDLPNMRALADDAVTFRNHYSVTAPCGPSRVSLLSGQYASNHGATRNGTPLKRDTPNLATAARASGYDPMLFGYTDTSQDPRFLESDDPRLFSYEELAPGFREVVRMRLESDTTEWDAHLARNGYDVRPYPDIYKPVGDSPDSPAVYASEHSDTAFLTDRLLQELSDQPQGWLAHLTYIRPHPPFVAPAPYNKMYAADAMPAPKQAEPSEWHPFMRPSLAGSSVRNVVVGFPDLDDTEDNVKLMRALYFGLATEVDHHIGRIIDWLKDTGQYDQTLIVVTADHGEMLGDYGLWGKQTFHDAAFHVPLIVRDPNAKARGVEISAPTESVDIAPTILDCIGADTPHSMDGRSLRPFLNGEMPDAWRKHTYSELDFGNPLSPTRWQKALGVSLDGANLAVLRKENLRFVHFAEALEPILIDVAKGMESENLAKNPDHTQTMLDLMQDMLCHRMVHKDGTFSRTLITSNGPRTSS